DDGAIRFNVGDLWWKCDLRSYQCTKLPTAPTQAAAPPAPPGRSARFGRAARGSRSTRSGDGKWTALIKDHNVFIRSEDGGQEIALSTDGKQGFEYGRLEWSPDSSLLVAFGIEPGERKEVYRVESSPRGGGRAVLHTTPYALPGDRFDSLE